MADKQLKAQQAVELVRGNFQPLKEPRVKRTRRHSLLNILVFSLTGALCGASGWEDLEEFAEEKRELFEGLLDMPDGTPSADTFRRVFGALDGRAFEECFAAWAAALCEALGGEDALRDKVVSFDGKTARGAFQRTATGKLEFLHVLHAWSSENHLLLAQEAVAGAPGEVKALPGLIRSLDLAGAVVTTDANSCTRKVAEACVESEAHYALALKGNRGALFQAAVAAFEAAGPHPFGTHVSHDAGHGREETRRVSALPLVHWPLKGKRWPGAHTLVRVERYRAGQSTAHASLEVHYYLSDLPAEDCERLGRVIRTHWGVENGLHWVLDVAFAEDKSRIRDVTAQRNWGLVQRMALNLLKQDTTSKRGIAAKRKKAGWSNSYLLHLLTLGITKN